MSRDFVILTSIYLCCFKWCHIASFSFIPRERYRISCHCHIITFCQCSLNLLPPVLSHMKYNISHRSKTAHTEFFHYPKIGFSLFSWNFCQLFMCVFAHCSCNICTKLRNKSSRFEPKLHMLIYICGCTWKVIKNLIQYVQFLFQRKHFAKFAKVVKMQWHGHHCIYSRFDVW